MVAYRQYIAKNVDFSISLLIKVWWSSQNFSAYDDIITSKTPYLAIDELAPGKLKRPFVYLYALCSEIVYL